MTDLRKVLARVRRAHQENPLALLPADDPNRVYFNADDVCLECGQDWPCDASRALDALTAVLDLADEPGHDSGRVDPNDVRAVIADMMGADDV